MALPPKWYQFLVSLFASLGSVLYGYDLGVIAEAVASDNFKNIFQPSQAEIGAVVSVFTGGAFCGAGFAGPVGDWLGRKKTILMGALIFIVGGGLQTGARSLAYLYAGRAIAGLGVGFLVMIIPLYQAELAHPSIRGRVTALQQFMLGIGALVASWTAYGCYIGFPSTSSKQWRISLGIQIVPAGFLALLILLFPESPRWLIAHGRPEDGLRTLAKLHAHGDESDAWVQAEFHQIQDEITFESEHGRSHHDAETSAFRQRLMSNRGQVIRRALHQQELLPPPLPRLRHPGLDPDDRPTIFAQIVSYESHKTCASDLLTLLPQGIATDDTLKYQGINSVIALIAQFLCILFIDWSGRRWAMIGGNLANCVTFIVATALLASYPPGTTHNLGAGWGFIIMTWVYNFSFSLTNGPLSWIVPAEIFDTRTRSKGVSIATMVSFAFNTLIGQITPIAIKAVGWRFYLVFVVFNFTNAVFFWAIQPETAKRPLEEMNYLFTNAPLFVPFMNMKEFETHDLENRVADVERKQSVASHVE
ncbi:hypothetical protein LTR53_009201 [Teratosphaeriaceae sp. CCFEE 6253]|nr:hypothetical protein LTR53_009201 [Teratosphaeriaceae sp. CCFEE 6253]